MSIVLYELTGADPARPFSPHCWKIAFALAHKGLAFERVATPFTAVASVEGGFSKTIPVIRDGRKVVADSFAIALYLEEAYPDRPTLFGGAGGVAMARFIERWSQLTTHGWLGGAMLTDIHARLAPADQAFFRATREKRFGTTLEETAAGRETRVEAFRASLEPLRGTLSLQPFIGGEQPLFCDHIVAGAFQWARVVSPFAVLDLGDPVSLWFERCLDLYGGLGRAVLAAA